MTDPLLAIRVFGDPILRRRASPVEHFDEELRRLLDRMLATMDAAGGKGIAGNQVGVLLRVFAWRQDEDTAGTCVNPEVVEASEEVQLDEEGCLSFPKLFRFAFERPLAVRIGYQDATGQRRETQAEGRLARTFMHEIDHLNGILFIDHLAAHDREAARARVAAGELDDIPQAHGGPPPASPQRVLPSRMSRLGAPRRQGTGEPTRGPGGPASRAGTA